VTDWWQSLYDETVAEIFLVRKDSEELTAAVAFLFAQLGLTPGAMVFDQCCGIGSLAVPLAARGVRVVGVDQAPGYIERASRTARQENAACEFHAADAMDFVPGVPCDGAFNWGSGFGYADDDRNRLMLRRAFEALRPGGCFLLDYQNIARVLRDFQACLVHRHTTSAGEVVLLRETEVDLPGGTLRQRWTFLAPDGRRDVRHSSLRLYLPHALAQLLGEVGFAEVSFHGGVRGERLSIDSPRCIAQARKAAPGSVCDSQEPATVS
jgi:SAM-dependent methyltransferase